MLDQLFGGGESPRPSTHSTHSTHSNEAHTGGRRRSRRAGRKSRRTRSKRHSTRRRRGGSLGPASLRPLASAAAPLTLLGLQKFFHGTKGRADLKAADRGVRRTFRRGRRSLRRAL